MEVQQALPALRAHGISVVAIGFSPQARLDQVRAELRLTFPLVSDPERRWYAALQVRRAPWRAVFAPHMLKQYGRLIMAGRRLRWPTEDLRQLGAGALFHGDEIAATWVSEASEWRPSIAEVVAAAQQFDVGRNTAL